jgi:glycosyltransferase involved in cell wall biosynthesis
MSKLRILHVTHNLGRGGAEQALVNVLPSLAAQGTVVELAVLLPPYTLAGELEHGAVKVHRLDLKHQWNLAQGVPRLARLIQKGRFDVVHGHSFFTGLYIGLTRPFSPHARRFLTFHNLGYDSYPADNTWRRIRKKLDATLSQNAIDVRLAVSPAVAEHYRSHLGVTDVRILYNGISVDELRPVESLDRGAELARYHVSADDHVLVMCGRFVHEKGHRYLLDALVQLRERGLRPKALLVGDGPLQQQVAAEVERIGLTKQVTIHPSIPHRDMARLMQAADLLVLASTHEGFPLAPAEAMALERPVVATRVGGVADLIEDGVSGLLIQPGDPGALANAIALVLADPEMRLRLGREGRMRVERHFSTRVAVEKLLGFYSEVPQARSARPER